MHHRLGHSALALEATREAVRVAQQSGDEECISYAAAWSSLLRSLPGGSSGGGGSTMGGAQACVGGLRARAADPGTYRPLAPGIGSASNGGGGGGATAGDEDASLRRCRDSASDRGMPDLAAAASLELGRRALRRGGGKGGRRADPLEDEADGGEGAGGPGLWSEAWSHVEEAGLAPRSSGAGLGRRGVPPSMTTGGAADGHDVADQPTDIRGESAPANLGRRELAAAGVWEGAGRSSTASLSAAAALELSSTGGGGRLDGDSAGAARDAVLSSLACGGGAGLWSDPEKAGEKGAGRRKGAAYASILAGRGGGTGKDVNNGVLDAPAAAALHEWSVRSSDLPAASGLLVLLANRAALPSGPAQCVDATLSCLAQSTLASLAVRDYGAARDASRRSVWLASRHGLVAERGRALLRLARVELEAAHSHPSPLPEVERCLPSLLECISLAEGHGIGPLRSAAMVGLAQVHLGMGRVRRARSVLSGDLGGVLEHCHVRDQGEALLTLAKCHLASHSAGDDGGGEKGGDPPSLASALRELDRSLAAFEEADDVRRAAEVHYLRARAFHLLPGREVERDDAAAEFVRLSKEARSRSVAREGCAVVSNWDELRTCVSARTARG